MYQKYFVYLDCEDYVVKVAVAAENEKAAKKYCEGNGEIIAIKNVTKDFPIEGDKVAKALINAGFGTYEQDFIVRALSMLGITE